MNREHVLCIFAFLAFPLFIASCGGNRPPDPTPALGDSISRAQVRGQEADGHVVAVVNRVTGEERLHLTTAHDDLTAQAKDLTESQQALNEVRFERGKMDSQITTLTTELKDERNQWLGDRTHHLIGWIIGIAAGLWLLCGVLGAWLGPASVIGTQLLHFIPFSNPFAMLMKCFHR